MYSGEVRGEVGARSGMCYVGWVVCVHGFCYYIIIIIIIIIFINTAIGWLPGGSGVYH